MLASTYASPASLLLRLGECRSRYRETASGLIATTGTPAARNAAGSNPFEVSIATVIGSLLRLCCSANMFISCVNPATVSSMRSRTRCVPPSSTMLTS